MPPKSKASGTAAARAKSGSAPQKAKAQSKAHTGAKGPAPAKAAASAPVEKDPDVERQENLLKDFLAETEIARVDGRVLEIAVLEARTLAKERGLNAELLARAEKQLDEYKSYEAALKQREEELRAARALVLARHEEEQRRFKAGVDARKRISKRVEDLFDAVGDGDDNRVRKWLADRLGCGDASGFGTVPALPVDVTDHQGNTPLSEAACYGMPSIVELLLTNGAHPNSQNEQGRTPIWRACYNGHVDVVQLLLEQGGDPFIENANGEPAGRIGTKETKALISSWTKEMVEERQETHLTPLQRLTKPWPSILLDAIESGDVAAAQAVITTVSASDCPENLTRVVVDTKSVVDGLWLACMKGHVDLCSNLLDLEGDIDSTSDTGLTCLMIACRKGYSRIVELLLRRGARTHLRSDQGMLAAQYGREVGDGHVYEIVLAHCRRTEDWTTLEESHQTCGNKAVSVEVLETFGNSRASKAATNALKAMSAGEIREGGARYQQLLEERALADVLGMG